MHTSRQATEHRQTTCVINCSVAKVRIHVRIPCVAGSETPFLHPSGPQRRQESRTRVACCGGAPLPGSGDEHVPRRRGPKVMFLRASLICAVVIYSAIGVDADRRVIDVAQLQRCENLATVRWIRVPAVLIATMAWSPPPAQTWRRGLERGPGWRVRRQHLAIARPESTAAEYSEC